ncbi:peptidase inhibitor family I36 protein [Streptomyces sp. NPDC006261]|uniref:peptidase inhibitor family I36 protein n=1 Tax=Streptomyces sp. NPDC006261 TaxID=3156739 RepID=UPI0033BADC03
MPAGSHQDAHTEELFTPLTCRRLRALLGLALAVALLPIAATSAHAGSTQPTYSTRNPGNCPAGNLCVYKGANYATEGVGIAMFQHNNPVWSETRNRYISHEDSSWFNNGTGTSYSSVMVWSSRTTTTAGTSPAWTRAGATPGTGWRTTRARSPSG